jgi:hypothetical protein
VNSSRWKHFAAMVLVGDGVMALVRPKRDAMAWSTGPIPWRMVMRYLNERPMLTRLIGIVQIAGGVCWALSSEKLSATTRSDQASDE